jgi:hypothetical protein
VSNGPQPALTDLQIAAYARKAGFMGDALRTIIAVVLAESGGDPDNVGDESLANSTWGPSIGLGQVRSLRAETGTGRPRDATKLTDPAFNLRSAFAISSGGSSFRPWTMFTNGRYKGFLARAQAAIAGTPSAGTPTLPPGFGGILPGGGVGGLADKVADPLIKGLGRITLVGLFIAGGVALVAAGAWKATAAPRAALKERADEGMKTAAMVAAV